MNKLLFIVFAAFSAACSDTTPLPADPQATPETQALYRNLFRIADEGVMFGHQDDALYGHDWKYEEGRSDVRECCGDYPAVFGWELGGLETGADRSIDDVPFAEITRLLCAAYGRGAVNTVSWHPQNPESGASAWDGKTSTAVSSILPGGANHAQFRLWLDRLAGFFVGLKSADGTCVPVLFRPFHEHTGSGFWWGEAQCTPDEYKALWRFTVEYLRDVKGVHNLLYVYSPDLYRDASTIRNAIRATNGSTCSGSTPTTARRIGISCRAENECFRPCSDWDTNTVNRRPSPKPDSRASPIQRGGPGGCCRSSAARG